MPYSSKDFGATRASINTEIPEKLIHRDVVGSVVDEKFSQERKHPVQLVDLPTKNISVTLGGLAPKQSTNRHRHTYETVLFILEGEGETQIEDKVVEWRAGDAVYVPMWAWHRHTNHSEKDCRYLACENAPQLQNLGVALREEGD